MTDDTTAKPKEEGETPSTRNIQICIPDDAAEGDTIEFVVAGQQLELTVSADMKPGSVVQLTLAAGSDCDPSMNDSHIRDNDDATEENIVKVPLYDDIVLNLLEACNTDGSSGDGTSAVSWSTGEIMSRYLAQSNALLAVKDKSVCELGAGLGSCGLAAAIGGASSVMMTDYGPQHLQKNIDLNLNLVKSINPEVEVHASKLIWGEERQSEAYTDGKQYDIILGSDILYDSKEGYDALVQTCNTLCATTGEIYIGVRWRKPHLERSFFQCMEKYGFSFIRVNVPTLPCTLDWQVYGTDDDAASCKYLQQTILARGEKVPLCEVTEDHQRVMTDEEYQEFEVLQTQIFRGKRRMKRNASSMVGISD